jgi:hypothetical protein
VDVDGDGIFAEESYFLLLQTFPLWQKLLKALSKEDKIIMIIASYQAI